MNKDVFTKIENFVENYIPYETVGSIEPTDDGGYRVKVQFFDTILGKEVDEYLYFTISGEIIQN